MVPCLPWWEFVKGFLREDISEVMVLGWHHVLEGSAYLSLLRFLGQLLQWGIHSPNVVFCPLRGDEHGINHISRFWSIILHHASICPPSTLRRASRHGDILASPVNFWVEERGPLATSSPQEARQRSHTIFRPTTVDRSTPLPY